MASITSFLFLRHLRCESSAHVLYYRRGRLVRSGRGLSFWFLPLSASLAEVPTDDRDQTFLFRGRTRDFQEVTAQGTVTYRVAEPEKLAARLDFSIDPASGRYLRTPLDQLAQLLTQLAQQAAGAYIERAPVRELLAGGVDPIRERLLEEVPRDPALWEIGLQVVSVRVASVAPTAELEKALQAPTREGIQQAADEAAFQRRALAVEKERAIQENELQNRIELARREEQLIGQHGQNELRRAREEAEARRVAAEAEAERSRLAATVEAEGLKVVEEARVGAERERIGIYRDVPRGVLLGLAARELAGKLERIDHLNVSPELLGPLLSGLIEAGTRRLEGPEGQDHA